MRPRSPRIGTAQPTATFTGADRHPTLVDKAAALAFSLVASHPFVDGNKRIGHAEVFLVLNGYEIDASVDEQERLLLDVVSGSVTREHLADWLRQHVVKSSQRAQAV